ncbi:MAG: histone deacetylase [Anaerolineae bacterium]|nr:histone deacetylase [Anaerolineae bacterium]
MTTAYVTDTRFSGHTLQGHVEHAGRLAAIHELLDSYNLPARMTRLTPLSASDEQILAVHTERYLELLTWTATQRGLQLDSDTYVLPQSFEIAKLASGAAIRGVDAVLNKEADNALVVARPPGHHATPQKGMGFCLLNNIAMAARHAQNAHSLKRVLIVDYDVHHGNGTQDAFYSDPSVLFISTHQYPWYPGTGAATDTGAGEGAGATVNIPLPAGVGNLGYAQAFEQIVWHAARRFSPELILVSAGFDAHWADPLCQMRLDLQGYAQLTRQLIELAKTLCDGKIVFVMEGGYNLTSLSHGWLNVAYALLGDSQVADPLGAAKGSEPDISALINRLRQIHRL